MIEKGVIYKRRWSSEQFFCGILWDGVLCLAMAVKEVSRKNEFLYLNQMIVKKDLIKRKLSM